MDTTDTEAHLIGIIAELAAIRDAIDPGGDQIGVHPGALADTSALGARIGAAIACLEGQMVIHGADLHLMVTGRDHLHRVLATAEAGEIDEQLLATIYSISPAGNAMTLIGCSLNAHGPGLCNCHVQGSGPVQWGE